MLGKCINIPDKDSQFANSFIDENMNVAVKRYHVALEQYTHAETETELVYWEHELEASKAQISLILQSYKKSDSKSVLRRKKIQSGGEN